jgi:hypothetical protein
MTLGMTIIAILSTLLIGGAALSAHGAIGFFRDAGSGDWVMGILLVALALLLMACEMGAIMAYRHESGPTFELLRSDWRCTGSHVVQDDDGDYTVCDQYSRI